MTTQPAQLENPKSKIDNPPVLFPGHLTLLLGSPGSGKSLLSIDLAARLSTGRALTIPPSPSSITPRFVLIASKEDDARTIRNRLAAADADLHRIQLLEDTSLLPPRGGPAADSHLLRTLRHLQTQNAAPGLLILDPLPAFLHSFDCHHASSIRRILNPLLDFARQTDLILLGIIHRNKSPRSRHQSPLDTTIGSHAYPALARCVLSLTNDAPPIPTTDHQCETTDHPRLTTDHRPLPHSTRYLLPLKNNALPITHAAAFTIQGKHINESTNDYPNLNPNPNLIPTPNPPETAAPQPLNQTLTIENQKSKIENLFPIPYIQWLPNPLPYNPHLTGHPIPKPTDPVEQSQLDLACHFLQTMLKNGPFPAKELTQHARTLQLSPRTLARARAQLNTQTIHDGDTGTWYVSL